MSLVKVEVRDDVAVISMNRPERHNALNNAMGLELRENLHRVAIDKSVRAILLRGEGKSFSSGRDTNELGGRDEGDTDYEFVRRAQEERLWFFELPKPTVAAMKGYTFGGALEMCLACDIRIASPDLVAALPEVLYGILPDTGGTQFLTSLIGPGRTKEMVMTGCRIDGQTAYDWGIVNRIVPREQLDEVAFQTARTLAEAPPLAVKLAKDLVDDAWKGQVRSGMRRELLAQTVLFASDDYREARAARSEGRRPTYRGQ